MSLPDNLYDMSPEEISEWARQTYSIKAPIEKFQMKFKLGEDGWTEVKQRLDWNEDYSHIQSLCGDNPLCYLDHYNHHVLSQTEVGNYLYNASTDTAQLIGNSLRDNFWQGVNVDKLTETFEVLADFVLLPIGG